MIGLRKSSVFLKLFFIIIFFIISPIALLTCIVTLKLTSDLKTSNHAEVLGAADRSMQVYAPLPEDFPQLNVEVESGDGRVELISRYLKRYGSPLYPYSKLIVDSAEKYEIDWRLITAIAQQESNLCKKIPPDSYNCWGWGIHSRGSLGFSSYEEGIETVSKGIKDNYVDQGLDSVEKIMAKYTPLSNGSWAFGVEKFIDQMR